MLCFWPHYCKGVLRSSMLTEILNLENSLSIISSLVQQAQEFITLERLVLFWATFKVQHWFHTSDFNLWNKECFLSDTSTHLARPLENLVSRIKDSLTCWETEVARSYSKIKRPRWAGGDFWGGDDLQHWQRQKAVTALVHMPLSLRVDCTETPDTRKPAKSGPALGYRQGWVGLK